MRTRGVSVVAVLLAACAAMAQARSVQFKDVPADAAWLAHIDGDAAQSSVVMKKMFDECIQGTKLAERFDKMKQICGMDPRKDLHGLTLYGTEIARDQGVLIVRAKLDKEALLAKAEKAPDHRTVNYGDHEIHMWTEKKGGHERTVAGTFQAPDVLVLASSVDLMKTAIDVFDGKVANLQSGQGPLATEVPKGAIFLVRAIGIGKSPAAKKYPLCSELVGFDYAEGENDGQWHGHITVATENDRIAERVESALKGLRAMFWLHMEGAPKFQHLLDQVEVGRDGKTVVADFQVPASEVAAAMPGFCELIKSRIAKHHKMAHGQKQQKSGPAHKTPAEKKPAKKKSAEKKSAEKKPAETSSPEKSEGMRWPTARQGTPVLGVVIGKPENVEAAEVLRVWEDSPAAKAGLKPGDRIVKVDQQEITSPERLREVVLEHKPGDQVALTVERKGEQVQLDARLAGGDDFAGWARPGPPQRVFSPQPWLGIAIGSGEGRGVAVAGVLPGSSADRAGLKKGDTILRVDKTRTETPTDLQKTIAKYRPGETVELVILRDDSEKTIKAELGAFAMWEGRVEGEPRELLKQFLEGRFPFPENSQEQRDERPSQENR